MTHMNRLDLFQQETSNQTQPAILRPIREPEDSDTKPGNAAFNSDVISAIDVSSVFQKSFLTNRITGSGTLSITVWPKHILPHKETDFPTYVGWNPLNVSVEKMNNNEIRENIPRPTFNGNKRLYFNPFSELERILKIKNDVGIIRTNIESNDYKAMISNFNKFENSILNTISQGKLDTDRINAFKDIISVVEGINSCISEGIKNDDLQNSVDSCNLIDVFEGLESVMKAIYEIEDWK